MIWGTSVTALLLLQDFVERTDLVSVAFGRFGYSRR